MLSGVGLASAFDWDSERINYESVRKNFDELDLVERLRIETIYCDKCGHRLVIDCRMDGVIYCNCSTDNTTKAKLNVTIEKPCETYEKPWYPYIERQNMVIWRREEQPGLYAYKGISLKTTNNHSVVSYLMFFFMISPQYTQCTTIFLPRTFFIFKRTRSIASNGISLPSH